MYHVSSVDLPKGSFLKSGSRGYVCLAVTIRQALYWVGVLYSETSERAAEFSKVKIYEVEVLGDRLVEDCPGHYAFEYQGVVKRVEEVRAERHERDFDGEVVTRNPVRVIGRVENIDVQSEAKALHDSISREIGY